jgi:hypothetical protein
MRWILTLAIVVALFWYNQVYKGGGIDAELRGMHTSTMEHVAYMNDLLAYAKASANYRGVAQGSDQGPPNPPRVALATLVTRTKELEVELKSQTGEQAKKRQAACKGLKATLSKVKKLKKFAEDGNEAGYNSFVPEVNKQIDKCTEQINALDR